MSGITRMLVFLLTARRASAGVVDATVILFLLYILFASQQFVQKIELWVNTY